MNKLDAWFSTPAPARTPDALHGLLLEVQDRVYNFCFQVLRQREDAEDAAQQALLSIARDIGAVTDADHFRRWMYRVTLHAALKVKARRPVQVPISEALMSSKAPDAGGSLAHALQKLGDDERALIVEHYYERRTLEEIGQERGISAVAIWKRISKAREALRAGLAVGSVAAVDHYLEGISPVTAPRMLVSATQLGSITIGGLAMLSWKTVGAAAVLFVLMAGVVAFAVIRRAEPSTTARRPVPSAAPRITPASGSSADRLAMPPVEDPEAKARQQEEKRLQAEQVEIEKERERRRAIAEALIDRNQKAARSAMRTIPTSQADFRSNDRDNNGQNDYWVGDLSGLWRIKVTWEAQGRLRSDTIKLISREVSLADRGAIVGADYMEPLSSDLAPYNGYWFRSIDIPGSVNGRHPNRFAHTSFPNVYGIDGRLTFLVDENNCVYEMDLNGQPATSAPEDPVKEGWTVSK